jgi:CRISPR-associated exonuclease Cas4
MTPAWLALIALALILLALMLRRRAKRHLAELDMQGEVVYWDGDADSDVFVSHKHALTGRPDYILKSAGSLIPVERKSRSLGTRKPYDGEILQLAAYCLLVEERFGSPVQGGRLQYQDQSIDIAFDASLRRTVLTALHELHEASGQSDIARSHNNPVRCRSCGFRDRCTQSLARN